MSDLEIEYRPTIDLKPYAENARTHSEAQIAQIAASITAFGWTNPVLVDDTGGLIAGHGRVRAASLLGRETVPTITLRGLTEQQKRALVIADNQIALNAGWDEVLLSKQLSGLGDVGFDLNLIGFTSDDLNRLTGFGPPKTPPDEFKNYDENIATDFTCPKCNFRWSGKQSTSKSEE